MKTVARWCGVTLMASLAVSPAAAQTIDLGNGGADQVWRDSTAGAKAGRRLDQGALSPGDNRRDLVISAPGSASVAGRVYVLFSGPVFSGDHLLSTANVVVNGPGAGDEFGSAVAIGPVTVNDNNLTSNLVVGAPGALGGRGAVYVFATPMENGTYNASSAVYTIEGATGDRLGAALATADINNDGYRELIIGAPGNNRIYVLAGASTLSGTRNLGITGGDLLITGAGIGSYLQAGDLTGDGVYEIVIGSPVQNAVYLLTGSFPDVSTLPGDADAVFTGIDPGDAIGASMRLADLDADGLRDLVLGAPGGDGPGNSTPNAGEVYVLWGRSTFPSMSMAAADVTFYGGATGHSLGEALAAGDINRDTPNDLVLLASGANAAGELLVYYGRPRAQIGAMIGGRRIVDFASMSPSRRIAGDPASGPIVAAQVYEVTGEGARDVVVGVPADNGDRGGAFFTISPKVIADPSTITLSVPEGDERAQGVTIRNPSVIPITWTASANKAWLVPWPNSGTSSSDSPGSLTAYIYTAGLPLGTHNATLTYVSTSDHVEMTDVLEVTITVTAPVCTFAISPTSITVGSAASSRTISVTTRASCAWTATSNSGFIAVPDGVGRTGSGSVTVNVGANSSQTGRNGSVTIAGETLSVSQGGVPTAEILRQRELARADFNGDGDSDLLLQDMATGSLAAWTLDGHTVTSTTPLSHSVKDSNWRMVGSADFNADGKPDILWHHQTEGWVYLWYMNGVTKIGDTYFSRDRVNPGWKIMATGDFNADGKTDVVWQNEAEGRIAFWLCNGVTVLATHELPIQFIDTRWHIAGAGDFNGDGETDLLLRHGGYGEIGVWLMNGLTRQQYVTLSPGAIADQAWRVAAIIDANADNKPDIIWHHTDGWVAIWYMNGTVRSANPSVATTVPANWRIAAPK